MSLSEAQAVRPCARDTSVPSDLSQQAVEFAAALETVLAAGEGGALPDEAMQILMAALIKTYAVKFDQGQRPALLAADSGVSATAVLVTTSALMKASNLEIFELGMWQSWSGTR